jgi:molybdopterin molybdotransferase
VERFEDAQSRLLALARRVARERVAVEDACGRVLAAELVATEDLPPFDYSAMDGYAVRTADCSGDGPFSLTVRGEAKTGSVAPEHAPGTACRIFTGAPMPRGADAVIMQEHVTRDGATARFEARPRLGAHVRRRAEDLAKGEVALAAGTRLRAVDVALAAALDRPWLEVARRPTVTIVSTGDELRAPGSAPAPGTIPESNGAALRAMAERAGAMTRLAPFVPDDREATERAFDEALRATDLLVTIGGVSVGDHDLVRPALERVGVTLDFWRVAMKPGKPLAVGRRGDAIVLGLPGNPASAMVTFALFGVPLLRAMQGELRPVAPPVRARLARPIAHEPGRVEFVRATLERVPGGLVAHPLANQASGAVVSMARANALVCVPQEARGLEAGELVDAFDFADLGLSS